MNFKRLSQTLLITVLISLLSLGINYIPVKSEASLSNDCDDSSFPEDWKENWRGKLQIFNRGSLSKEIPMGLDIYDSADSIEWHIIYGAGDSADIRKYALIEKNKAEGHYAIDERNSIILDAFLFRQKLTSIFSVNDIQILATYEYFCDSLIVEMYMDNLSKVDSTGGVEDIPIVMSYPMTTYHRAVLYPEK